MEWIQYITLNKKKENYTMKTKREGLSIFMR